MAALEMDRATFASLLGAALAHEKHEDRRHALLALLGHTRAFNVLVATDPLPRVCAGCGRPIPAIFPEEDEQCAGCELQRMTAEVFPGTPPL